MNTESTRIVALAGTLCSPTIFAPLAERLRGIASLDAISWMTRPGPWDIPSLGAYVAESIAEAGPGPVVLIGHSTGGAIALQLALERPDLIRGLVLVDTGPNMHGHSDVDSIVRTMSSSWGPELFGSVLDRSFAAPLRPEVRQNFVDYANTVRPEAAIQVLTSQRAIDFVPRLAEIRCPTAIIHGALDPTRTVAQAEEFAAAIAASTLTLLPCGHSPMFELPSETAAIVQRML